MQSIRIFICFAFADDGIATDRVEIEKWTKNEAEKKSIENTQSALA